MEGKKGGILGGLRFLKERHANRQAILSEGADNYSKTCANAQGGAVADSSASSVGGRNRNPLVPSGLRQSSLLRFPAGLEKGTFS